MLILIKVVCLKQLVNTYKIAHYAIKLYYQMGINVYLLIINVIQNFNVMDTILVVQQIYFQPV